MEPFTLLLDGHIGRVEHLGVGDHHALYLARVGDDELLVVEPDPGAVIPDNLGGLEQQFLALGRILLLAGGLHDLVELRIAVESGAEPLGRVDGAGELAGEGEVGVQEEGAPGQEEELQLGLVQRLGHSGDIGRPVVRSEFNLDADGLEVGLDGFGDLLISEKPAVGRSHVDDLVEREVGLLQEGPGFLGVVIIPVVHARVPPEHRGKGSIHGLATVKEKLFADGLLVHRVVEGVTDQLVLGDALLAVHAHVDDPRVQGHLHRDFGIGLERGHVGGQRLVADVDLAGPEHSLAGGRLRHNDVSQLGHGRPPAVVVLVADKDDALARDPLLEDIGAGPDRIPAHVLAVLLNGRRRDGGNEVE